MAAIGNKGQGSKRRSTRLVVTGKRVKGTWLMESVLPAKPRRAAKSSRAILTGENRRVRTLH